MEAKTKSNVTIGFSLRHGRKGVYTVNIRYYENKKEDFLPTEYRVTRDEWDAKKGETFNQVNDIKDKLSKKASDALKACGEELTFFRFKAAFEGKKLSSGKTLVTLLDKHLEKNPKYTPGTVEGYEYTKRSLKTLAKKGVDLDIVNFSDEEDIKKLESEFKKHFEIGRTVLSMHMRRIKAIGKTGKRKDVGWVKTDAFEVYKKPKEKKGTEPNSLKDFKAIEAFDCGTSSAMMFGRDFYVFMVYAGGMEARSIALLKYKDVNEQYFRFTRSKTEESSEDTIWVYISVKHPFIKYIFETYAKPKPEIEDPEDYVFPFLKKDMDAKQIDTQVMYLAERIRKNVQKVGKKVNAKPRPNCKRARPTFAILSDELGLDIFEASQMMGHASIKTTQIYFKHLPTSRKLNISETYADKLGNLTVGTATEN
jgi:integrase